EVRPDDPTSTTIEPTTSTVPDDRKDAVEQGDDNDQGAVVGKDDRDNDEQDENECEVEEQGELEHDDDATPTTVVCTPSTETTVPGAHDAGRGGHPTVTTVPEADDENRGPSVSAGPGSGDDRGATTPTTASNSGRGSGDDSHSSRDGGGDSSNGG